MGVKPDRRQRCSPRPPPLTPPHPARAPAPESETYDILSNEAPGIPEVFPDPKDSPRYREIGWNSERKGAGENSKSKRAESSELGWPRRLVRPGTLVRAARARPSPNCESLSFGQKRPPSPLSRPQSWNLGWEPSAVKITRDDNFAKQVFLDGSRGLSANCRWKPLKICIFSPVPARVRKPHLSEDSMVKMVLRSEPAGWA